MVESGAGVLRHRLIQSLCAFVLLMAAPSVALAEGTTVSNTDVTLQGDANGTGCAIWLEPAEPIRFGALAPPTSAEIYSVSQKFSLRVVNGKDVWPSTCTVTTGGAPFVWNGAEALAIHEVKLAQSPSSTVSVLLVPQVNAMASGELQSVLVKSPTFGGRAIVVAVLDISLIPELPVDAAIVGTLTFTMSDIAP
jgi:hypothetical protein